MALKFSCSTSIVEEFLPRQNRATHDSGEMGNLNFFSAGADEAVGNFTQMRKNSERALWENYHRRND